MRKLIITNHFKRAHEHYIKKFPYLKDKIASTLLKMEENIFHPSLLTHSLSGKLFYLKACSCGYDCRIVFMIENNKESGLEEIILLDIGNHDTVY